MTKSKSSLVSALIICSCRYSLVFDSACERSRVDLDTYMALCPHMHAMCAAAPGCTRSGTPPTITVYDDCKAQHQDFQDKDVLLVDLLMAACQIMNACRLRFHISKPARLMKP